VIDENIYGLDLNYFYHDMQLNDEYVGFSRRKQQNCDDRYKLDARRNF